LAQLTVQLRDFLGREAGSAGLLLGATVFALLWANSPWSASYERLWSTEIAVRIGDAELLMDLRHWVNDGLMVVFFLVIGLELRREVSVGELTDRRGLVVPTIAAVGGLVVPAALYLALNPSGPDANGWGVVIGTDTAFLFGVLALVGPTSPTQLRVFLLAITIIDDVLAVSVIGVVYSESIDVAALLLAIVCVVVLALLGRWGVWQAGIYLLVGTVLWVATLESGLHPTIAGMVAGLAIAARPPQRADVERAASLVRAFTQSPLPSVGRSAKLGLQRSVSVNERLQEDLHWLTTLVIVPVFALANAGVDLRGGVLGDALGSRLTWGVVVGLVVGKFVGVGGAALGAARLRLGRLPQGVGKGQVLGGAALSGIGFTVSLLIASLAFEVPVQRDRATVGVLLAGVLSALVGWAVFKAAAVFLGERSASLPMVLVRDVELGRDHILGRGDAPLTLVEYADFECPFCGRATGVVREVRERLGDRVRYVFRHLPLPDVHEHAEEAGSAVEAAGAQGKFWEMHDLLFKHQGQLQIEDLVGYAATLDLDVERFLRDLSDERHADRVREDVADAEASGARGTPTFFVNGRRHVGPWHAENLIEALMRSAD
jgi:Na+/H+ antiporter NhaA